MALSALVGAGAGLMLGRQIDAGRGQSAVLIAWIVAVGVVVMRASSLDWPELAVAANALGALVACLLTPAQMTPIYNMAKVSPCPLRFHIASEGGWDVGCFSAAIMAALLASAGVSLAVPILLAVPAVTVIAVLLRGYYARHAVAIDLPVMPAEAGPLPSACGVWGRGVCGASERVGVWVRRAGPSRPAGGRSGPSLLGGGVVRAGVFSCARFDSGTGLKGILAHFRRSRLLSSDVRHSAANLIRCRGGYFKYDVLRTYSELESKISIITT